MKVLRISLLTGLLLLVGCSGSGAGGDSTASDDSAANAAAIAEPTATTEEPEPEPTATPLPPTSTPPPTATPTPVPTEEPIFTRAELPAKAVSDPTITMWGAATPTESLPWAGFGHRYDSTVGLSVPIAWSFPDGAAPEYEPLPLPPGSDSGNAWYGANTVDGQLAAGRVFTNGYKRAAFWFRSDNEEWQLDASFAPDLLSPNNGQSEVRDAAGGDSWAMLQVIVDSPTDNDDDGDPVATRHILLTRDVDSWEVVTLPGVTAEDWFFGIHISGDHGLIAARIDDDNNPASRIFTTDDAGASWQDHDLELVDGLQASISDALWQDGEWFGVGSIGADDEREPAIFSSDAQGTWQAQRADLTLGSIEPFENGEFQSVRRLDDTTLLAVADTDPGSQTFTSTNGVDWTADRALWINRRDGDATSTTDFARFIGDLNDGPMLATRQWAAPVWFSATGAQKIDTSPFDRVRRDIKGVVHQGDRFVAITGIFDTQDTGVQLWESPDGLQWELQENDPVHRPLLVQDIGDDAIFSYGTDADNFATLRIYGGSERSIEPLDILDADDVRIVNGISSAFAARRNLVAATLRVGEDGTNFTRLGFVDLSDPGPISSYAVPGAADGTVDDVCPEVFDPAVSNAAIPVLIRDGDGVGSTIEVWADRNQPRLGVGTPAEGSTSFDNAIIIGCGRFGLGLAAVGVVCSDAAAEASEYSRDECGPGIWTTEDGFVWAEHPGIQTLEAAGVQFSDEISNVGPGSVLIGIPDDSDGGESLWLLGPTDVHQVPLDSDLNLRRLAVSNERVLLATTEDVHVAPISEIVERTLDGSNLTEWQDLEQSIVDYLDELVAEAREQADQAGEATTVPPVAPTSAPASGASPTQPAATPVPTATSALAPTTPPTSPGTLPTCNPGDLTTTGSCRCTGGRLYDDGGQCKIRCRSNETPDGFGGCTRADGSGVDSGAGSGSDAEVIITSTLVCETTTDPQTGAVTEVCEVVNE